MLSVSDWILAKVVLKFSLVSTPDTRFCVAITIVLIVVTNVYIKTKNELARFEKVSSVGSVLVELQTGTLGLSVS